MARLNTHVAVQDENLRTHVFGPDDVVPEWAVEKITNPYVWVGGSELLAAGVEPEQVPAASEAVEALATAGALSDEDATAVAVEAAAQFGQEATVADLTAVLTALPVPPKQGPKATVKAWSAYAQQEIAARGMNIAIPADVSRKDIIEALEGAGIPTGE